MLRRTALAALILAAPALAQTPPTATPPAPAEPAEPNITVTGRGAPVDPLSGPRVFLSPMGEPFRSDDKLSGAEHWFRAADTNGDNRMTKAEYMANVDRFFGIVDRDHDGVIGPDEITRFETEIAPETRVESTIGDLSKISQDSDGNVVMPPYPDRIGAGRYSYIKSAEPIVSADLNMDRGITKQEYDYVASKRFQELDVNGDGMLVRAELPHLNKPRDDQ